MSERKAVSMGKPKKPRKAAEANATKAGKKASSTSKTLQGDARFAHVSTDKRFKPIPKLKRTVKIDPRFEGMFTNKAFKTKFLDEGGNEELRRLYHTNDDEQADTDPKATDVTPTPEPEAARFSVDYSRGEVLLESSDESDDDDEDGQQSDEELIDVYSAGHVDGHETVPAGEETDRLAICNLTWDKITASDLFVLANSFKPATGVIKSVAVYPSEFGIERMAKEDQFGPGEFLRDADANIVDSDGNAGDADATETISQRRLRLYELSKMKYYYAVVECDSVSTASTIYDACDGLEFEKSQNMLDLRYIPADTTFDDAPKERVDDLPTEIDFKLGEQNPLAHSNLKVTWDEDNDDERVVLKKRKFTDGELEKMDFSAYMGSNSEESELDDDEPVMADRSSRLKALIEECTEEQDDDDDEPEGDMEVTWTVGLKEKTETLLKARQDALEERRMTMGEKADKKRKEKKKARKDRIKQLMNGSNADADDDDTDDERNDLRVGGDDPFFQQDLGPEFAKPEPEPAKTTKTKKGRHQESEMDAETGAILSQIVADEDERHFDMNRVIKDHKRAGKKEHRRSKKPKPLHDSFKLDTSDARFGAVFGDKNYSIDPTVPEFKKTREMDKLIEERQGRLRGDPVSPRWGGDSDVLALAARAKKRVPKKNTR